MRDPRENDPKSLAAKAALDAKLAALRKGAGLKPRARGLTPDDAFPSRVAKAKQVTLNISAGPPLRWWSKHPPAGRPSFWHGPLVDTVVAVDPASKSLQLAGGWSVAARDWYDPLNPEPMLVTAARLQAKSPVFALLHYDRRGYLYVALAFALEGPDGFEELR